MCVSVCWLCGVCCVLRVVNVGYYVLVGVWGVLFDVCHVSCGMCMLSYDGWHWSCGV